MGWGRLFTCHDEWVVWAAFGLTALLPVLRGALRSLWLPPRTQRGCSQQLVAAAGPGLEALLPLALAAGPSGDLRADAGSACTAADGAGRAGVRRVALQGQPLPLHHLQEVMGTVEVGGMSSLSCIPFFNAPAMPGQMLQLAVFPLLNFFTHSLRISLDLFNLLK